jgi:hypothetical protein
MYLLLQINAKNYAQTMPLNNLRTMFEIMRIFDDGIVQRLVRSELLTLGMKLGGLI